MVWDVRMRICRRFLVRVAWSLLSAVSLDAAVAQQRPDAALHYVANTRLPDAYLALRTQPTAATGTRISTMPNGTALRVLERRANGWWRVRIESSGQEGWALAYQGNRTWIECCLTASISSPPPETPAGFKTPSGNIHCQFFEINDDKSLRCDIREMTNRPRRPRDCDLEWGDAFEVNTTARVGERVCHGDTIVDATLPSLAYGQTWEQAGFRCRSEQSGVTCANPSGHGFELSKGSQRVF
jgi:hypothetical protein